MSEIHSTPISHPDSLPTASPGSSILGVSVDTGLFPPPPEIAKSAARAPRALHRLGEVRQSQGISVSTLARRLEMEPEQVRAAEDAQVDMLLSELYRWRDALDVPVSELVIEPEDLPNNPIRNRGLLLRIMKTVRSILDNAHEKKILLLAQTLSDQLIDLMPELQDVSPWPTIGQAREFKDYGQAVFRRFDSGTSSQLEE